MAYMGRVVRLANKNPKAANEMLATIAAGVHAGEGDMTGDAAARRALETLEAILIQTRQFEHDDYNTTVQDKFFP